MNEKEIVKVIMKERKIGQIEMAKEMGYAGQGTVSRVLSGATSTMTVATLTKMLDILGCDLVVKDRANKREYTITEGESDLDALRKKMAEMQRKIEELESK